MSWLVERVTAGIICKDCQLKCSDRGALILCAPNNALHYSVLRNRLSSAAGPNPYRIRDNTSIGK